MTQFIKVEDDELTLEEMLAIAQEARLLDQVYQSEAYGHFNASLLLRLYAKHPEHFELVTTPMDPTLAEYIIKNVEINPDALTSIDENKLEEPVVAVTLDDECPTFLIDGHHRVVKRYLLGKKDLKLLIADRWATERVHVVKRDNRN